MDTCFCVLFYAISVGCVDVVVVVVSFHTTTVGQKCLSFIILPMMDAVEQLVVS